MHHLATSTFHDDVATLEIIMHEIDLTLNYKCESSSNRTFANLFCFPSVSFLNLVNSAVPPPIEWAQRADILYVTVIAECKDVEHKWVDKQNIHSSRKTI